MYKATYRHDQIIGFPPQQEFNNRRPSRGCHDFPLISPPSVNHDFTRLYYLTKPLDAISIVIDLTTHVIVYRTRIEVPPPPPSPRGGCQRRGGISFGRAVMAVLLGPISAAPIKEWISGTMLSHHSEAGND